MPSRVSGGVAAPPALGEADRIRDFNEFINTSRWGAVLSSEGAHSLSKEDLNGEGEKNRSARAISETDIPPPVKSTIPEEEEGEKNLSESK